MITNQIFIVYKNLRILLLIYIAARNLPLWAGDCERFMVLALIAI